MGILSTFDRIVWGISVIVTFVVLFIVGGGWLLSWYPDPIDARAALIAQYFNLVYIAGMFVSALFVGTFFYFIFKFWDREQPAGLD
tara:strand:+ start:11558 stop:11815 length:258 start_codon:yes stop_codon:yes gene_type:complete